MIDVNKKIYRLTIYSDKVNIWDIFRLSCYSAFQGENVPILMKKELRSTVIIDLLSSETDLLMNMKSNTRNEIRKGIKEEYIFKQTNDINEFVTFYNDFASYKGLSLIRNNSLTKFKNLVITQCIHDDNILAMHATILDKNKKIARLLYSASPRLHSNTNKKNVGIANRFLHYQDLIFFKKQGFIIYDFAGICDDKNNKELYGIDIFKRGFGGKVIPAVFLFSPFFYLFNMLKKH